MSGNSTTIRRVVGLIPFILATLMNSNVYYRYGKALLGLSREESGVLGDAVPGANTEDGDNEGKYLL